MLLTVHEVAVKMRVSRETVRSWITRGELRAVYLPGSDSRKHARVHESDLADFYNNLRQNKQTDQSSG